jgi:hypothetical protein
VGFVLPQVMLHRLDGARLRPAGLPQLPHHPIIKQSLPQLYNLNVRVVGLPQLPVSQGREGFLPIRSNFHNY